MKRYWARHNPKSWKPRKPEMDYEIFGFDKFFGELAVSFNKLMEVFADPRICETLTRLNDIMRSSETGKERK